MKTFMPNLVLALAAVAVFIVLGASLFIVMLCEDWHAAWKREEQHMRLKSTGSRLLREPEWQSID